MVELCFEYFALQEALRRIKFYLRTTHVWLMFGHELAAKLSKAQNKDEMNLVIDAFFSRDQAMIPYTDLRQ